MVPSNQLTLSVDQFSSQGIKLRNEDCIGIRIPQAGRLSTKGAVALVADGVSATEFGKEAAETCVMSFMSDYFSTPDSWSVKQSAHRVLVALNRWLFAQSLKSLEESRAYVCTLSAVVLKSTQAHIFHIGDSRIYLYRDGLLEQVTEDHTAQVSADRSYLAKAMGMLLNIEIDYRTIDLQAGDILLLSTDGLHDFLTASELSEALLAIEPSRPFAGQAHRLVQTALDKGSDDNISCQLVRVDHLGLQTSQEACRSLSELPFPPPLSVGESLDGYRVIGIIHESQRSQAYLVKDPVTDQRMVMKTPSPNYEDDPAYIERFQLEEWIARRVHSSHVVSIVEKRREASALYYFTEYVEGVPLSRWIRDNSRPDIGRVVQIVEQVVKGLRALHRKEILHQDVKPDNILIDNQDRVTLVDFGSCWIPGVQEMYTPIDREVALGTACYSAPEYVLGLKGSLRSELFAVAVVTYEMLTGKLPYGDAYENAKTPAHFARLKYTPAYHYNPLVPGWLDGSLKKALQLDSRRRYNAFSEWIFDLRHPNPRLMPDQSLPLVEKNPLLFWQVSTGILLVGLISLLAWFTG